MPPQSNLDLPKIPDPKQLAQKYDLIAKKALGQNFLFDLNITRRIVDYCGDLSKLNIIEVGPGPGGLTAAIAEASPASLTCIEFDERAVKALAEYGVRAKIVQADALHTDLRELTPAPRAIIANLPYNIGSKLLTNWLYQSADYEFFCLMFQKEVAERIVAQSGDTNFGRLAIFTQVFCHAEILFDLPPEAFSPPPKVTSSVIMLRPHRKQIDVDLKKLERVTQVAFGQRRKMLRGSLKQILPDVEKTLTELDINPQSRAQELTIEDYVKLAKAIN